MLSYHRISIRTADIFDPINYFETLEFEVETRFTAVITLAGSKMQGQNWN